MKKQILTNPLEATLHWIKKSYPCHAKFKKIMTIKTKINNCFKNKTPFLPWGIPWFLELTINWRRFCNLVKLLFLRINEYSVKFVLDLVNNCCNFVRITIIEILDLTSEETGPLCDVNMMPYEGLHLQSWVINCPNPRYTLQQVVFREV